MMKLTLPLGSAFVLAACMMLGSSGVVAGRLSSLSGTAVFRCPSLDNCPDDIGGDGTNYSGTGAAETGQGAHLYAVSSGGEMWIGGSSYTLGLHFPLPDGGSVHCLLTSTCRKDWSSAIQVGFEIQSNVVGPSDASPLAPHGLYDVPIGGTWRTRLKVSFADPQGRNLLWGLNFNTIDYQNATNINVTRTDECRWVFEPADSDRGGLSAFGSTGKGKSTRTDEGLYVMRFQITLDVPSCQ